MMACLSWNCRGLGQSNTKRALRNYISKFNPSIIFLMETKQKRNKLNRMRSRLNFTGSFYVDPIGRSGGLAIWWTADVNISVLNASKNFIDTSLTMEDGIPWYCTFVYGCPSSEGKSDVWRAISNLRCNDNEPWCLIGDFNEVTSQAEKLGGCPFQANSEDPFLLLVNDHGLLDMPLKGGPFTWNNKRTDEAAILEKIDRILFNIPWNYKFKKALGIIEPALGSDHNPLVLLTKGLKKRFKKEFKFESKWLLDHECKDIIKNEWSSPLTGNNRDKLHWKLMNSRRKILSWRKARKGTNQVNIEEIKEKIARLQNVPLTEETLPSDTGGAFADWATAIRAGPDDLSLGFNANAAAAAPPGSTNAQWPPSSARPINYGLPPEMGMVGLRDFVVVAPASFNHHHHHHHHHTQDPIMVNEQINGPTAATALGVGVIPLLTAAPCLPVEDSDLLNNNGRGKLSGMQLWQNQNSCSSTHYLKKPSSLPDNNNSSMNLIQTGSGGGGGMGGGSGGSGSSSGTTCQDCGNQAKKDCSHRRCRTCCKSRGFDCTTHVKSTWVPAARRRERQLMTAAAVGAGSSGSTSGTKKPRLVTSQTTTTSHTSTSNTTPRSFDTSSSHQDAGFKESLPGQVRAPAVFKCVRVTAVEDGEDEYAYQAVVKIGGRVFKGFLYDQGVEGREGFPNISELHLGGGAGGGSNGGGRNAGSASSPVIDPSEVYAAASGGFLGGGSGYGNPIN
ncbi:hypothetical protein GQ457_15G028640 [Hibiscus cannabinus]